LYSFSILSTADSDSIFVPIGSHLLSFSQVRFIPNQAASEATSTRAIYPHQPAARTINVFQWPNILSWNETQIDRQKQSRAEWGFISRIAWDCTHDPFHTPKGTSGFGSSPGKNLWNQAILQDRSAEHLEQRVIPCQTYFSWPNPRSCGTRRLAR